MTLVSVITPTWQRHDLLLSRCIPSVVAQTYPDVEHVIISDGPDPELEAGLFALGYGSAGWPKRIYGEVVHHDPHPQNWGSHARNRGLELATGDLVAYLDDDNAFRPDHLERLVEMLTTDPAADFAYSRMHCHPRGYQVGAAPPVYGHLDSSLLIHRRGLPERLGRWPAPGSANGGDPHAPDWGVVAQWLAGGARWAFVDAVTVDYYARG